MNQYISFFLSSSRPHTALPCPPEQRSKSISPEKSAPALGETFAVQGRQLLPSSSRNVEENNQVEKAKSVEKQIKKSAKKKFESTNICHLYIPFKYRPT